MRARAIHRAWVAAIACLAWRCTAIIDVDKYDDYSFCDVQDLACHSDDSGEERLNSAFDEQTFLDALAGEWSTDCIPGRGIEEDNPTPGFEYIYTVRVRPAQVIRLDEITYNATCEVPVLVNYLEGTFEVDPGADDWEAVPLNMVVHKYSIKILVDELANEANAASYLGRENWVAGEWVDLLGILTDTASVVDEGDAAYVLVRDEGAGNTRGFSSVEPSLPEGVGSSEFRRTIGDRSIASRFP